MVVALNFETYSSLALTNYVGQQSKQIRQKLCALIDLQLFEVSILESTSDLSLAVNLKRIVIGYACAKNHKNWMSWINLARLINEKSVF